MGSALPFFTGTQLDIATDVRENVMRKYLASLVFAGGAYAASPLAAAPPAPEPSAEVTAPVAVQAIQAVQRGRWPSAGLRDEASMVLVGTALIGLAAAVRRAA
jgi:hypothetical protein